MPVAKRDCCLFLFDLTSSNKKELLDGLLKIATHKWFSASPNLYRLLLVNSKNTRNDNKFPHVFDPMLTDFEPRVVLRTVEQAQTEKNGCNWLDAILVGLYYLGQAKERMSLVTLQLVFFTDLVGCLPTADQTKIQEVVKGLNDINCFLYIIGPDIKLPFMIKNPGEVHECMKQIVVDKSNSSLCAAKEIIQNVPNSVLCDVKVGVNLFYSFKNLLGTQHYRQQLNFGTKFSLAMHIVRLYGPERIFRIRTKNPNQRCFGLEEDKSTSVKFEDIQKGMVRYNKTVVLPDNKTFRLDTHRSIVVLGCTKQENVPSIYFYGEETYLMIPDDYAMQQPSKYEIFYYLVKVLAEEEMCMIARRINNDGANPRYWVLMPQPDGKPPCFLMTPLPYADQVPYVLKSEKPEPEETEQTDDEFERFYKSIDVTRKECILDVPLSPRMMLGPQSTRLTQILVEKTLGKTLECDLEIPRGENKFRDDLLKIEPAFNANDYNPRRQNSNTDSFFDGDAKF